MFLASLSESAEMHIWGWARFGDLIKFIGISQGKDCLVLYTNVFGYDKENRTRVPILLYRLLLRELTVDPKVKGWLTIAMCSLLCEI
jgi:hypothetical protein